MEAAVPCDLIDVPERRPARSPSADGSREMAAAKSDLVAWYMKHHGLSREGALARVAELKQPETVSRILATDPADLDWFAMQQLAEADAGAQEHLWQGMLSTAADELASGSRAAKAIGASNRPADLAQFIALRQSLADDWHPRNGIEWRLIDMMAQSFTLMLVWQERFNYWSEYEPESTSRGARASGRWAPPRMTTAEAIEMAREMVERYNRMFLRNLRSLRDLRRYAPKVIVQNAGQVNVAGQQVVAAAGQHTRME